jgi:hypothetical protein
MGWIYYRKGFYNTAVSYLKKAVAQQSTPRRQFHLALCYLKSGQQELGQKELGARVATRPHLYKTEQGW